MKTERRYYNWGLEKQDFTTWSGLNWLITGSSEHAGYIPGSIKHGICWPPEQVWAYRRHCRLNLVLGMLWRFFMLDNHRLCQETFGSLSTAAGHSCLFPVCGDRNKPVRVSLIRQRRAGLMLCHSKESEPTQSLYQRWTNSAVRHTPTATRQSELEVLKEILTYFLTPWSRVLLEKLTSELCS
jgi:hypothetical protein